MRKLLEEYNTGKITWDEAYRIANNNAATASEVGNTEEVEYWTHLMNELGVELADQFMKTLGYKQNKSGSFFKPGDN